MKGCNKHQVVAASPCTKGQTANRGDGMESEQCYKPRTRSTPYPSKLTIRALMPSISRNGDGEPKRNPDGSIVLIPRLGKLSSDMVVQHPLLIRARQYWPSDVSRVLDALIDALVWQRWSDVKPHAVANEDGVVTVTTETQDDGACVYDISRSSCIIEDATYENVYRYLSPHLGRIANELQVCAEHAGMTWCTETVERTMLVDPITEDRYVAALSILQAWGIVGEIDPYNATLINPTLALQGSSSMRKHAWTILDNPEGTHPIYGLAELSERDTAAPDNFYMSGIRKPLTQKALVLERKTILSRRAEEDAVNARQAHRIARLEKDNAALIERGLHDALTIGALQDEKSAILDNIVSAVREMQAKGIGSVAPSVLLELARKHGDYDGHWEPMHTTENKPSVQQERECMK